MKSKKKYICFEYFRLSWIVFILMSCNNNNPEEDKLGNFDISTDCKTIVFSYYKQGISSIYTSYIDGSNCRLILSSKDSSFVNPTFSPDGNRIVYIAYKKGNWAGILGIADIKGEKRQTLVHRTGLVTEAVFLTDNKVVFCLANKYSSYSPLASKDAHGFDLYSLNVENNASQKLTNLSSYGTNRLARKDTSQLYMRMEGSREESGMYLFSLNRKDSLIRIEPKNDPRSGLYLYYNPSYNTISNSLAFVSPYQIYTMDLKTMIARLAYNSETSDIQNIKFANEKSIFFSKTDEANAIYKININDSSLTKIPINIK